MHHTRRIVFVVLFLTGAHVAGCARQFPGPIEPQPEARQTERMSVLDDGTVSYALERLEIGLRPMSDAELNRAFPGDSDDAAESTNPYTYGNWVPLGDSYTPQRFTVFLLRVKNYEYPKVQIDPRRVVLRSTNRRVYETLDFLRISEYYRAHALAWAGNAYRSYRTRAEILRRTMYRGTMVFSGQEDEGYLVFEALPADVTEFSVTLQGVALRFNYADEPVETIELTYNFGREIFSGYAPPAELGGGG